MDDYAFENSKLFFIDVKIYFSNWEKVGLVQSYSFMLKLKTAYYLFFYAQIKDCILFILRIIYTFYEQI